VGRLTGIDTVLLLDLDGTLYVGSQVVPGASETVRWLRAQGLTVRFTTNTDSIPPTALADRLAGPGERATHVLVADPSYGATYDDLNAAFRALRSEAQLITTQVNRIARRDDGEHLDTGGWVRLLEYATGQTARVLGKPSPEFLPAPLNALGRGAQARWWSATTRPPTSVVATRSARRRCWFAAARVTAPARRRGPTRTRSSTASPTRPDFPKA
jgi:ribonucleotide monophosphatase NagD (HAD superfamily)